MPKFIVILALDASVGIDIEADTAEEAAELAEESDLVHHKISEMKIDLGDPIGARVNLGDEEVLNTLPQEKLRQEVNDRDALLADKNKRLCAMRVDRTRIALHRDALAQAARALSDRLPAYPSAAGYFAQKELVALRDELATPDVAYAPVPDTCLHAHLRRQIAFSTRAFGPNDRWRGVVDHIKKELTEIEASPYDVEEWIDVALLALDGAWRSLAATREMTPAEMARKVVETLDAKMTKNENRDWPDWRTADRTKAIEHDRSKDRGTA